MEKTSLKAQSFVSLADFLSVSIGPSSSHTAGPMKAAYSFSKNILDKFNLSDICDIRVDLYGSLALTGVGHGTEGGSQQTQNIKFTISD